MTQPISAQKKTNEQDDINENNLTVSILKEVRKSFNKAVAHHKKVTLRGKRNKSKHKFNFRSEIIVGDGSLFVASSTHLKIFRWFPPQKRFANKPICFVSFAQNRLVMNAVTTTIKIVDISDPDCFDVLSKSFIELLEGK